MRLESILLLVLLVSSFSSPLLGQGTGVETAGDVVEPTRLDIRTDPVADLYMFVRTRAAQKGNDIPPFLLDAVTIARRVNSRLGNFTLAWGYLDGWLEACCSFPELKEKFAGLPEKVELPGGRIAALRDDAVLLAEALAVAEKPFLEKIWPAHRARLEEAAALVLKEFKPKEALCLAHILGSLGMKDPSAVIPVLLTCHVPFPGAFTCRCPGGGGVCFVGVSEFKKSILFEGILHEATHVLDLMTVKQDHVLNDLRKRLGDAGFTRRDRMMRDAWHTIFFIQAAETVKRFIDPGHRHYGDAAGYYSKVAGIAALERPLWTSYLDGKLSREEAVDKIIDGVLALSEK